MGRVGEVREGGWDGGWRGGGEGGGGALSALFQYHPNPAFVWKTLYSHRAFGITFGATR